jgi:hypothetical protein
MNHKLLQHAAQKRKTILIVLSILFACNLHAQVKYDEGSRFINGVQLLQDKDDANAYYYIPRYPKLATNDDGTFELLCMKYVGNKGEPSGGLFHALLEFSLPQDSIVSMETKLKKEFPQAKIVGPVKMSQPRGADDVADKPASFEIISAILSNKDGKDAFTKSVISSGYAPLTPGSRAAIAALLNPQGATLLWNSLTGAASDISVSISGTYEAYVKGYNATVTADVSTVYTHMSKLTNYQQGYTKEQARKIVDDLRKDNSLKIEVFDRSAGLGIKTADMDGILKIVTDKLIELMFDTKAGWAKDPVRETAVEAGQLPGRQERGYFWQVFGGAENTPYISDDQFVLKNRKDIQVNTFYLNLSKATTIQVPIHTTGNIAGLYKELGNDPRYFKIIDMNDPAFERRSVYFQIDGETVDAFSDLVNFASISFRKKYTGGNDNTQQLMFQAAEIKDGKTIKDISYPRLGLKTDDFDDYEYRIDWGIRGANKTISIPAGKDKWNQATEPVVQLILPFRKNTIEIDASRQQLKDSSIASAVISIAGVVNGQSKQLKKIILRPTDAESVSKAIVFRDENTPLVYSVKWYSNKGAYQEAIHQVDVSSGNLGYLLLTPPSADKFK